MKAPRVACRENGSDQTLELLALDNPRPVCFISKRTANFKYVIGCRGNTNTNATNHTSSSSSFFIHSSEPVKYATIVRHQIGREQASKCVHRNVTASKRYVIETTSIVRKRSTEGTAAYDRWTSTRNNVRS